MLNQQERYKVFVFTKYLYAFSQFPCKVDLKGWKINPECTTGRRKFMLRVLYFLHLAHCAYKITSLATNLLSSERLPLHQAMLHAGLAGASALYTFWYYLLHVKYSHLNSDFVAMTLKGDYAEGLFAAPALSERGTGKWSRFSEYSLQDLIAIYLPHMILVCIPAVCACFVYDPTLKLLLYSALPARWKSWAWFCLCLIEEVRLILFFSTMVVTALQIHVITFDQLIGNLEQVKEAASKIRYSKGQAQICYAQLHALQVYTLHFNEIHRQVVFTWKLACIGFCILCGYAAMAHFNDHPIFGIAYYIGFMDSMLIYTLVYGKAFKVPQLFHEAVNTSLVGLQLNKRIRREEKRLFRTKFLSILPLGIKVGEFHTMERISTPVFVNYVLSNVASMLVVYG